MAVVVRVKKPEKVVMACCTWCGHARVQTKDPKAPNGGRVLRASNEARDFVCTACSAWKRG